MARVKGAMMTRKRRKKILKLAKGYFGAKSKLYRTANEAVMKSLRYAYIGRKQKKRDFRRLWITRISAACKQNGVNYSRFMNGLKKSGIEINRKMLADLAVNDSAAFSALVETAKAALSENKTNSRPIPAVESGRDFFVRAYGVLCTEIGCFVKTRMVCLRCFVKR